MLQRSQKKAILFDLDGTFANTSEDIFNALDQVLVANNFAVAARESLRSSISHGSYQLLCDAVPYGTAETVVKYCQQQFLDIYAANCCDPNYHCRTHLFAGLETVLQSIVAYSIPWGIVTNKRSRFTLPLLAAMELPHAPLVVVSGDTLQYTKPHPAPLLYACEQLHVESQGSVYVGDANIDVIAAHAANLYAVAAAWGYIGDADVASWEADAIATNPLQMLPWLDTLCT